NIDWLGKGASFFRSYSADQRAQWTAFEIAGKRADPGYVTHEFLTPVRAGDYLRAVALNGSPAYTTSSLTAQPETDRESADGALVGALRIHLAPAAEPHGQPRCHLVRRASPGSATTAVVGTPTPLLLRSRRPPPV